MHKTNIWEDIYSNLKHYSILIQEYKIAEGKMNETLRNRTMGSSN